jgi:nicotinate-nucleotide adenylyltransferase
MSVSTVRVSKTMVSSVIGILGGTFDPVHNGHIQMALDALDILGLDEVRLMPCHRPPHRDCPTLASEQRVELLRLAVSESPQLSVDTRELQRERASYTVTTLEGLRQELGEDASIVFILGADAFAQLATWYQWERLRDLAHIVVMARPNSSSPSHPVLQQWVEQATVRLGASTEDRSFSIEANATFKQRPSGGFALLERHLMDVSATAIRAQLGHACHSNAVAQLPSAVAAYIQEHGLYRPR